MSHRLGRRWCGRAVLFLIVAGFCCLPSSAPAQERADAPSVADEWHYTVRPGDTLWSFSREYLSGVDDWRRLQSLNQVRDPVRLAPGTRLRVPFSWMKAQPVSARVIAVGGQVDVGRAGMTGTARLVVGAEVGPGDSIATGADGSATVELADGSRVLLGHSGRVVFDVLSAFGRTGMVDSRLRIERGRTHTRITPRRGRFRIWTPAAATVVRGTEFRTAFDPDGRIARTEVTTGTVETSASAATVSLGASFGIAVREGEAPGAPVPLLPAPALVAEVPTTRRLPVRLSVSPLAGAVAYHLEVAPDDRFETLVFAGASSSGAFALRDLPDGRYAVRLRGVDAQGLQGLDALSALTVDARPEAPALMAPAPDAVVADARPALAWSRPADATGYRVQVAPDASRDTPFLDARHEGAGSFTPQAALAPGRYAWRVATRVADDEGPFGDWQSFTYRPRPPGPQPGAPRADAGVLRFAWPAGGEGSRYHVQIARDAAFADLVLDQPTTAPETTLAPPAPGTYYLRVRAIEADGYEGVFGPPQAFDVSAPPTPKRRFPWRLLAPLAPVVIVIIILL